MGWINPDEKHTRVSIQWRRCGGSTFWMGFFLRRRVCRRQYLLSLNIIKWNVLVFFAPFLQNRHCVRCHMLTWKAAQRPGRRLFMQGNYLVCTKGEKTNRKCGTSMAPWETADKTNLRGKVGGVKPLRKKFEFLIKYEFKMKLIKFNCAPRSVSNVPKPQCLVT